jgi:putative membrane protein
MMDGFGGHGWGMGWGWIIGLSILIAFIWIVVKTINRNNRPAPPEKSAVDILKDRYAKGEIDKEEFDRRKKDLM